ncbi:excalibur calcium-binding domain-containing protein [Thermodesulfobacteriota bacterium]
MNAARKYVFCFTGIIIASLITVSISFATTEFILLTNNNSQGIRCEFVEIDNNYIKCDEGKITTNFELSNVRGLEITNEVNTYQIQQFTTDNIEKINDINADKIKRHIEKLNKGEQSSHNFVQSIKRKYKQNIGNSTLSMIVQGVGFIIFLIGSFGYLIATFRTSIIWGLSCLFLPFVSFIFLFVHWEKASKPFFTSMTGIAIIFLGVLLTHPNGSTAQIIKPGASFSKTNNVGGRYTCSGKIYCSEMTSCDEAKFYLRNCPGTKIDGNNDGIPCEKQWCGQ